jgi:hypothetical protein
MTVVRDMTRAQFIAALDRNGFGKPVMGMWVADKSDLTPGVSYGLVYSQKPFRLHRRASLSAVIEKRSAQAKKRKDEKIALAP